MRHKPAKTPLNKAVVQVAILYTHRMTGGWEGEAANHMKINSINKQIAGESLHNDE